MKPAFFTPTPKPQNITPALRLPITNYTMLYQLVKLFVIHRNMAESLKTTVRVEGILTPPL
jgi:hypothetical protein